MDIRLFTRIINDSTSNGVADAISTEASARDTAIASAMLNVIKIASKSIGTYTINSGETISPNINNFMTPAPTGYFRLSFLYSINQNYFNCNVNFANGVAYATIRNNFRNALTSEFFVYQIYIPRANIIGE